MITEYLEDNYIDSDIFIPTEEEILKLKNKLENNEKLTFEDNLTLSKLKFLFIFIKYKEKNNLELH